MSEAAYMQNPDLAWDLDEFSQRQRALEFVLQFQSTLCVYSPNVLKHLSQLDRTNLANVITEKLESLFVEQQKTRVA